MQLGILARTFARPTFEQVLDAIQAQGLNCVQFNLACLGLPTLPDSIESTLAGRIRDEFRKRALTMVAISGTCNLIHPDGARRQRCLAHLRVLIGACGELGTSIITLCTGTRDRENMWRGHPDNRIRVARPV